MLLAAMPSVGCWIKLQQPDKDNDKNGTCVQYIQCLVPFLVTAVPHRDSERFVVDQAGEGGLK